jgi:type II secretory pathway pseudopilin PulG
MKKDKAVKFAFTLAEALVAIMIIGVLMALMLRSLNRVNPDKDKIMFIKTYHALETAVSDIINDSSKYDQQYYSEAELLSASSNYNTSHIHFAWKPYETVTVHVGTTSETNISRTNAFCYFVADMLNTVGDVNCADETGITVNGTTITKGNMRLSSGVCLAEMRGDIAYNSSKDFKIIPACKNDETYNVTLFPDGKLTVPKTVSSNQTNQDKAYRWINNQTTLNDKK